MWPSTTWHPISHGVDTISQAVEYIESNIGAVRELKTNDSVGVTFGSVFLDGRWQRFAIRTFTGVHAINYPSEYVEQYESGTAAFAAAEDAKRRSA
jgi:hypothetical protein